MKTIVAFLLFCGLQLAAQDMQSGPMHKQHQVVSSNNRGEEPRAVRWTLARRRSRVLFHPIEALGVAGRGE